MQIAIDNIEFVQCVHSEFINSLKNNGTKCLLIFDDSYADICNSREILDLATAGRLCGFCTKLIKHFLFHQNKLGRGVEQQNTHILLLKSPRDVHQISTLIVQLGLGSALVDWYRVAMSVPFGQSLIDLSQRTDDRSRYYTNNGNTPSKFCLLDIFKYLRNLHDEHTKFFYSSSIPTLFPRMQNSICKNLRKRFYPFSQRVRRQPAARNLVRSKNKSRAKVQRKISRNCFKKTTWRLRRCLISSQNDFRSKNVSSLVINHLS